MQITGRVVILFSPVQFGRMWPELYTWLWPKMYVPIDITCDTNLMHKVWGTSFSFFSLAFGNLHFIIILILKKFFLLYSYSPLYLHTMVGVIAQPPSLTLAIVLLSNLAPCWFGDQPPYIQGAAGWHEVLSDVSLLVSYGKVSVYHSCRTRTHSNFQIAWSIKHKPQFSLIHSFIHLFIHSTNDCWPRKNAAHWEIHMGAKY